MYRYMGYDKDNGRLYVKESALTPSDAAEAFCKQINESMHGCTFRSEPGLKRYHDESRVRMDWYKIYRDRDHEQVGTFIVYHL